MVTFRMQVFDFNDYRVFLKTSFSGTGSGRGKRGKLADFLFCQPSFLTQVLMRKAHLSLEHALKVCDYLHFTDVETQYFMLLVQKDKAGSEKLEIFFHDKILKMLEKRKSVSKRLKIETVLSADEQMIYYSVWYYSAIHIVCALPSIKTAEDIAEHLQLDIMIVKLALSFLEEKGFIKLLNGSYEIGSRRIHLKKGSAMLPRHHANWRMKAISRLDVEKRDDLHYTAVLGISKSDYKLLHEKILQLLEEFEPIVRDTKDEVETIMLLDLFKI